MKKAWTQHSHAPGFIKQKRILPHCVYCVGLWFCLKQSDCWCTCWCFSARGAPWPEGIRSQQVFNRMCGWCVWWCVEGSLLKTTRPDRGLYLINYAEQALEELRDLSNHTLFFSLELYYKTGVWIQEQSVNYGKEEQVSSDLVCQASAHL